MSLSLRAANNDDEAPVGRALKVAAALNGSDRSEFAKAGELVEIKFLMGQSLSLAASRLLMLMIVTAGGDAGRAMKHRLAKSEIRRGHHGNERINDLLEALHTTLFSHDDESWRGRKAKRRFSLLSESVEEIEDDFEGEGFIEFEFTEAAREIISRAQSYAVLDRDTIMQFKSSYTLRLYEIGSLRVGRRDPTWRVDIIGLRAAFGVHPDAYAQFAHLKRRVIDQAVKEINNPPPGTKPASFTVEYLEKKRGRRVAEVLFKFTRRAAEPEESNVVTLQQFRPANPSPPLPAPELKFPKTGFTYAADDELIAIAKEYGGGWDIDGIAAEYREWMGAKLETLKNDRLKRSFEGFCIAYAERRGGA